MGSMGTPLWQLGWRAMGCSRGSPVGGLPFLQPECVLPAWSLHHFLKLTWSRRATGSPSHPGLPPGARTRATSPAQVSLGIAVLGRILSPGSTETFR